MDKFKRSPQEESDFQVLVRSIVDVCNESSVSLTDAVAALCCALSTAVVVLYSQLEADTREKFIVSLIRQFELSIKEGLKKIERKVNDN